MNTFEENQRTIARANCQHETNPEEPLSCYHCGELLNEVKE